MLGKKAKSRIYILIFSLTSIAIIIFFALRSLEENVIYFFSPTEIYSKSDISFNKKIRLGGLVKKGSTSKSGTTINFIITSKRVAVIPKGTIVLMSIAFVRHLVPLPVKPCA